MYCTEYSSKFVWHENAYNVPKLHIRRRLKQQVGGPLTITQLSWISTADEHQKFRRDQKQFQITPEISKEFKYGNAKRYFDLDTDARGLKSHFLPAIIETYVEQAINCSSKVQNMRNHYYKSVYAQDFSRSTSEIS